MRMYELIADDLRISKFDSVKIWDSQQLLEEVRDKRKQFYYIPQKYADRNIKTRIKGDILVFTQSNSVYREIIKYQDSQLMKSSMVMRENSNQYEEVGWRPRESHYWTRHHRRCL